MPKIKGSPFYLKIKKDKNNNLTNNSFINVSQFRVRIIKKMGEYDQKIIEDISKKVLEIMDIDILNLRYF